MDNIPVNPTVTNTAQATQPMFSKGEMIAMSVGPAICGLLINAGISIMFQHKQLKKQEEMVEIQKDMAEKNYGIAKAEAEIAVSQAIHDLYSLVNDMKCQEAKTQPKKKSTKKKEKDDEQPDTNGVGSDADVQ